MNDGAATWVDIAQMVADRIGCELKVKPITLESAKLRAPRPRYSVLSPAKLAAAGIVMPPLRDALQTYLRGERQIFRSHLPPAALRG